MIAERMRIEYWPMRPSETVMQRQREVGREVDEVVERRCRRRPSRSMPDVGNQPRPAAKMTISGMPMTKYGIE